MSDILEALEKNKFDYEAIKNVSEIQLLDSDEYDINIIIGFRGRPSFIQPLINSFKRAFEYYQHEKKFCLTFVEHSANPENKDVIGNQANYIWTPGNVVDQYSRSFAYNFGVKYSNKAKYYILHDLDILVKENFFEEVYQNLGNAKAMQTYGKRRVLYMSQELTSKIIIGAVNYNLYNENTNEISLPSILGSKGGSILIEREFFYQIGGFDPELFWGYAAEDQIFWDKAITLIGEVAYADNPPIDVFHMWHPPTHATNPLLYEMENYMLQFRGMKKKDRMNFINLKKELFKNK
jgi:hypothetical protein